MYISVSDSTYQHLSSQCNTVVSKMLRLFYVEDRTLKRHISIGVFVVYIDTGSSMPISPSKSRDLADENNKILTEWK